MVSLISQDFTTTSPYIRSVNSNEFITGQGAVKHWIFSTTNSSGTAYNMSSVQMGTSGTTRSLSTSGGTIAYDFDTGIISDVTTIEGTTYIVTRITYTLGTAGRTSRLKFYLIRYDGSTETIIGQTGTPDYTSNSSATNITFAMSLTKTTLKRGDLLRLKVENDTDTGIGGTASVFTIGTDPEGTDNLTEVIIPFRRPF